MEYTLKIKDERYFNNGNLILPFLKDEGNHPLGEKIKEWLQSKYDLTELVRKNKHGVKAEALNKALRAKLEIEGAHKETHVLYNGFSHKGKEGFDFSFYDKDYNTACIRNYFVGERGCYNGGERLDGVYKDFKMTSKEWKKELSKINTPYGEDCKTEKQRLTVVGEIQFGNWAMIEHDIQRLMDAEEQDVSIDYYIYITATGNLAQKLSDGIVNYEKAASFFENHKLVKVPVWLIGLDLSTEVE